MNPISNSLSQLSDWWRNDPNALKKVLFISVASVLILIILGGVYVLNFGSNSNNSSGLNNLNNSLNNSKITPKNFQTSNRFDRVGTNSILANKKAVASENKLFAFDKDSKLSVDTNTVSGSPQFIPYSIYASGENVIINESKSTTIYNSKSKTFNKLNKITSLTPVAGDKFWYIKQENKNLIVSSTTNLINPESGSEGLGTVTPFTNSAVVNIAVFENSPYILVSDSLGLDGIMEIWRSEAGTFKQAQTLTGLFTVNILKGGILYTDSLNSELTWVGFKGQIDGKKQILNIQNQLASQKIQGNLIASRCAELNSEIYCLVKEGKFASYDYAQTDAIVKVSLNDSKVSLPFGRIQFSGDSLFFDTNKKLLILGQEDNNVYKLK